MKAIEFIYQELNNGRIFAEQVTNTKYPYLWQVLYLTPRHNIGFTHYGSSAVPDTMEDLAFILENIFKMSAEQFLEKYVSATFDYTIYYSIDSTNT